MIIDKLRYLPHGKRTRGTKLYAATLIKILEYCHNNLYKDSKKGECGQIFVYDENEVGIDNNTSISTGLILIDIDNLTKKTAEFIFNHFNEIVKYFPALIGIQYSASYYINPDKKCGLHIYVRSKVLNYYEYRNQAAICLYSFAQIMQHRFGIDLRNESSETVLDEHNRSMAQRFFLFYSEYHYNKNAVEFDMNMFSSSDIEKLQEKYGFELDDDSNKNIIHINPIIGDCNFAIKQQRIKIDRNFHIGKYSGNDIRYRISTIATVLFGDKAKDFCDGNFYCGDNNNESIYTHNNYEIMNPYILKWLKDNNYINENKAKKINNYLSDYDFEIQSYINNTMKLEVISPTGSGKTNYIANILAIKTNAVIIVPFNVTNNLYSDGTDHAPIKLIDSKFRGDIPKNKPCVMVWDQAIRYWEEIKHRFIIVDEAHQLFTDRNYRDSAIKLVMRLKEDNIHVCYMTATPSGESNWVDKTIEYFKDRNIVKFTAKCTKNVEWDEYWTIKNAVDNDFYDRVVLFDDMNAGRIYEKLVSEGYGSLISYIRADRKDTADFIDLRDNELLGKKITICTCIAFNGLNFKNTNERILVVGSIQLGQTTSCQIIQQIGRIRNSEVEGRYFFNTKQYEKDIDKEMNKTQEHLNVQLSGCTEINVDKKWIDPNYLSAMKEIQEYFENHATLDSIVTELCRAGYIKGSINCNCKDGEDLPRMSKAIKRQESDIMKTDITNGDYFTKDYDGEYSGLWEKQINRFISREEYVGLDGEFIQKYVINCAKNKLIETVIKDLYLIVKSVIYTDKEIQELQDRKGEWCDMLSDELDKKKLSKRIDTIVSYRNKYKDSIVFEEDKVYFTNVVYDIIAEEEKKLLSQQNGNSNGGKVGKRCIVTDKFKNPSKYNLTVGQEFESATTLSKYTNKSNKTITEWRNKGWVA